METTKAVFESLSDSTRFLSLNTTSSVCSPASYRIEKDDETNVKEVESKRCCIPLLIAHDNSYAFHSHSFCTKQETTLIRLNHSLILSFHSMEKEIADCLIRGDTPILPPESFLEEEKPEQVLEEEPEETKEEKVKRKKTKKRQFFRRVYLKKQKQIRNTLHPTPSSFQVCCSNLR